MPRGFISPPKSHATVTAKGCINVAGVLPKHRVHGGFGLADRDGPVSSRPRLESKQACRLKASASPGTAGDSVTTMLTTLGLALIGGAQVVYGARPLESSVGKI